VKTYTIANTHSGVILGVFYCETEANALDMMAEDAGYDNYAALCHLVPAQDGELSITTDSREEAT
jgi:hypothetical protein